ncbi:phosphatase [Rhodococcus ruber]
MRVLDHQQCETARRRAVSHSHILDGPFGRIAASWFGAPVPIVDADRIRLEAAHGLGGARQIRRAPGSCAEPILSDRPVADARLVAELSESILARVQDDIALLTAGIPR